MCSSDLCIGISPETSEYAEHNLHGCFDARIACGVSHLLGGITVTEVRTECAWLIRQLRRISVYHTLPIVVLCLGEFGASDKFKAFTPAHNASLVRCAARELRRAGFTPILCADHETLNCCLDRKKLGEIGLWYVRPFVTEKTAYTEEPNMLLWQYSTESSPRNTGISASYSVAKPIHFEFEPLPPKIRCHTVGIADALSTLAERFVTFPSAACF